MIQFRHNMNIQISLTHFPQKFMNSYSRNNTIPLRKENHSLQFLWEKLNFPFLFPLNHGKYIIKPMEITFQCQCNSRFLCNPFEKDFRRCKTWSINEIIRDVGIL